MNPFIWLASKLKTPPNPYPKTVAEVLDDTIKYRKGTDEAIIKFKKSKPWEGTRKEKQKKVRSLNADLASVYGIEKPKIVFVRRFVYGSCYFPVGNLIVLEQEKDGRYSVVTYLHEFGHALGKNEKGTCRWSINLFKKHFPKSFSRLVPKGHLLYLQKNDTTTANTEVTDSGKGKTNSG